MKNIRKRWIVFAIVVVMFLILYGFVLYNLVLFFSTAHPVQHPTHMQPQATVLPHTPYGSLLQQGQTLLLSGWEITLTRGYKTYGTIDERTSLPQGEVYLGIHLDIENFNDSSRVFESLNVFDLHDPYNNTYIQAVVPELDALYNESVDPYHTISGDVYYMTLPQIHDFTLQVNFTESDATSAGWMFDP